MAAELRAGAESTSVGEDLRRAVDAGQVRYVVVDFTKYTGPAFFEDHPTYVLVRPVLARNRHMKQ